MWGREIEIFRRWYRDSIILDNARNQAASSSMAMLWLGEICFIPFVLLGGYWLLIGKEPLFAITIILIFGPLSFVTGYMIRTKRDLARQREGAEPSEATQLAIIRKSLAWGFSVGGIVFAVGFIGPIILTPEANLGPMTGIFLGPVAFVIGTFLVGIGQIRPALTLPKWTRWAMDCSCSCCWSLSPCQGPTSSWRAFTVPPWPCSSLSWPLSVG